MSVSGRRTLACGMVAGLALTLSAAASGQAVKEHWSNDITNGYLRLDSQDNPCITTWGPENDFWAAKLDPNGNLLWSTGAGTSAVDSARWLCVDSQDNVIVAGESSTFGMLVVKYSADGAVLWQDSGTAHEAKRVEVDADDNIIVAGWVFSLSGENGNFFTVKYDPNGNVLWTRERDFAHGWDGPTALVVTDEGKIVMSGQATNGIVLLGYDADGNELFATHHPKSGGVADVKVHSDGSIYTCGNVTGLAGFVARHTPDGVLDWSVEYRGPHGDFVYLKKLALDAAGNIVAAGYGDGRLAYTDWATIKLDPQGSLVWADHYDAGYDSYDERTYSVTVGPDGAAYVAGHAGRTGGRGLERTLVKYQPDGATEWVHRTSGGGHPLQLYVDSKGELVMSGAAGGELVRLLQEEWVTLGSGLAGTGGVPALDVRGYLEDGAAMTVTLSGALPGTFGWHIVGLSRLDAPFQGGTLVPSPDLLLPVRTDATGWASFSTSLPAGLPSPIELYMHTWLVDPGAPRGMAGSNAVVKATH